MQLRNSDVWCDGRERWNGKEMIVENKTEVCRGKNRALESGECEFKSYLCHMLELCDTG